MSLLPNLAQALQDELERRADVHAELAVNQAVNSIAGLGVRLTEEQKRQALEVAKHEYMGQAIKFVVEKVLANPGVVMQKRKRVDDDD